MRCWQNIEDSGWYHVQNKRLCNTIINYIKRVIESISTQTLRLISIFCQMCRYSLKNKWTCLHAILKWSLYNISSQLSAKLLYITCRSTMLYVEIRPQAILTPIKRFVNHMYENILHSMYGENTFNDICTKIV